MKQWVVVNSNSQTWGTRATSGSTSHRVTRLQVSNDKGASDERALFTN
jgi:hypothetical protein